MTEEVDSACILRPILCPYLGRSNADDKVTGVDTTTPSYTLHPPSLPYTWQIADPFAVLVDCMSSFKPTCKLTSRIPYLYTSPSPRLISLIYPYYHFCSVSNRPSRLYTS